MKIKIVKPKPVPTPPPTLEVSFDEVEVRFIHRVLGRFSTQTLVEHLNLDGGTSAWRVAQIELFDKIFDELKPVIGALSDQPVTLAKK